ncbi:hypothetical protein DAEQUDRAFT_665103, partial [Daedalea quercina L-15889]
SAAPFFRAYSSSAKDYFYTTNCKEMHRALTDLTYTYEGSMGLVLRLPTVSTTLLYRLYSLNKTDHFYTDNAIPHSDYRDQGTSAYVFETQVCGSILLYRLYSSSAMDHFYTTSETQRENALKDGYSDEGIACYVLPTL